MIKKLTKSGNNLRLQPVLALEPRGKVADTPLAIRSNVRDLADVVVHVARGEQKNRDERDGGPDVAGLEHGHNVRPGDVRGCQAAEGEDRGGNPAHPVDGSFDGGVWAVGEVAGDPGVDYFGDLRAEGRG